VVVGAVVVVVDGDADAGDGVAVTVNLVDRELGRTVAVTDVPRVLEPAGTVKLTLKLPDASVVNVATCVEPKVSVPGETALKLDPAAVTVVPAGPLVGLSVRSARAEAPVAGQATTIVAHAASMATTRFVHRCTRACRDTAASSSTSQGSAVTAVPSVTRLP